MSPPTVWDGKSIEILRSMWADGSTAQAISDHLMSLGYRFTRNAVIGKKNRLKLPSLAFSIEQEKLELIRQKLVLNNKTLKQNRSIQNGKASNKFFFHRKPQALGAQAAMEVVMDGKSGNSAGSNAILLTQSGDGQCRAIIGYENGELGKAVVCGEPTPLKMVKGRAVRGSWCQRHNELYTQEDRPRR